MILASNFRATDSQLVVTKLRVDGMILDENDYHLVTRCRAMTYGRWL